MPLKTTWATGETVAATDFNQITTEVNAKVRRSVSTITAPTTLGSTAGTDYVVFASETNNGHNTITQLSFNGNITDVSVSPITWTASGTAATSTTQNKFGTASLSAGTGAITATAAGFGVGTGDFTLEFWIYPVGTTGRYGITDRSNGSLRLEYSAGKIIYYDVSTALITGGSLTANVWTHVVVCRSSGSTKLFYNGTQSGSTYTDSKNYTDTAVTFGALDGPAISFNGYLDDFRFTKNALYTTTFTAPTTELATPSLGTPTLPTAASNTNRYSIRNVTSTSLTIGVTSSQKINGASGGLALASSAAVELVSNGSNWFTL